MPQAAGWLVDPAALAHCATRLADAIAEHAAANPLEPGMPLETARQVTGMPDARLIDLLLGASSTAGGLAVTEGPTGLQGLRSDGP